MHAAILAGFAPGQDPGRPLWRVDADEPLKPALYVVSSTRPDLTHLEEQAGWPSQAVTQSTSYEPFLESLAVGQMWSFRLTANPTHRVQTGERSKIVAYAKIADQVEWLLSRQETLGVSFGPATEPAVQLVSREVVRFARGGSRVTLGTASFAGSLEVVDPAMLRQSLVEGIGRAKAYGCGLMTLARS